MALFRDIKSLASLATSSSKDLFLPGKMGESKINDVGGKPYPYGTAIGSKPLEKPVNKSWLFEVVDRQTDIAEPNASFTLILPPQSYSIKEPQRVSITKTFGNAFVDDYGPDNLQITLKGISGTSHVFPTYHGSGSMTELDTAGYNAKDAFYEFRNTIMRYKDNSGWEKKYLRVYDLADEQSYKCILLDFSLDRSSDQPLHYPYTISLFVYARLDSYAPKVQGIRIWSDPITEANKIDAFLAKIEKGFQNVQDIMNVVGMIRARTLELRTRWNAVLRGTSALITSPLDLAKNLVDTCFDLVRMGKDAYDAGKYTYDRYVGLAEFARETLNSGLKIYGYQITEGWQKYQPITIEIDDGLNPDPLYSTDSRGLDTGTGSPTTASGSGTRNSVAKTITFSGLNLYTVTGNDTYQSIALDVLGDSNLWMYVAYVNPSVDYSTPLVPGTQIFIPVTIDESSDSAIYIFSEDKARDPYGADIQVDSNGNLVFVSNDAVLVAGIENVIQSVNLRLNTETGSMIKQAGYGIVAQAGFAGTTIAIKYLKMAVVNTLVQDPRIKSVNNMNVVLESDTVFMSMNINIIGAERSLPVRIEL